MNHQWSEAELRVMLRVPLIAYVTMIRRCQERGMWRTAHVLTEMGRVVEQSGIVLTPSAWSA